MEEITDAFLTARKPEEDIRLGRSSRRWDDNTKLDLKKKHD
jgi:hypothetical protein